MKVLLISANTEKINMPTLPMGLACVAAAARRSGHVIQFLDLMAQADVTAALETAVRAFDPQVIGVSIRNIDDQVSTGPAFLLDRAKPVVDTCKRLSDAPVVLGGAGYSMFPESALTFLDADMGIQGEGEVAFVKLLERLSGIGSLGDVPGLYLKHGGRQGVRQFAADLDALPFPHPDFFDRRMADDPAYYVPIQTRRGCPLACSYCSTPMIEGAVIRKRSPRIVVKELARWRRAGFKRLFFVDNTFNLPPSYAIELCERLVRADLDFEWRCILYPGSVTEALVDAMARAGCRDVSLGFESGSPAMLKTLNKRFGRDDIERVAALLQAYGIRRMGFLMLGGPGETRSSVMESLQFADALKLDALKITIGIRIYPQTRVARMAAAGGLIGSYDELLRPKFYIEPGLEDWLRKTVNAWMADRPNWLR
jgi:radical SAM superfamily enzyme YgiQ (UPF0313 family)